ncbi:ATP-sensitive inward rectifier potassium channel 12-like [Leguminivora glycinivorella]|uniref:ATP-sensitive inward rectifier potassium channel 12-like n=1 Tax=Leguminivora glycinivorella TaxID=1035111 RepID=UPI0020106969|nr:ATP-sensitive inward rectifier potassium channel 12-like [Leguminivora glycinivorella]XP_047994672.1 ATP-sensitive inward rectifier potassium channel 12-like [Leguminivora glycinivorella]
MPNNQELEDTDVEPLVKPGIYHFRNKSNHHHHKPYKYKSIFKRAVFKNGEFNIEKFNSNKKHRFFTTWFVTMVRARWRWTLLNFVTAFISIWLFFGCLYWLIAMGHGDFNNNETINGTEWTPCIREIYNFTSAFLFSIEVHTTVAYGHRKITLECPDAIFTMCMQCIVSMIFQAFMIGILFAKLTRPKNRTQTILFSKNAVIYAKDGKMCIVFRVGDMRKSRILNIKALMYIIRMDRNDSFDEFEQIALNVELDGCESTFFLWPISVIHVIDETSPFYNISAPDLLSGRLEILVVFEGIIESTGQPLQAKSSYTSNEILWGHRFVPMIDFNYEKKRYNVDFSKLGVTEEIDTPLCSVHEYESILRENSKEISLMTDDVIRNQNSMSVDIRQNPFPSVMDKRH